MARTKADIQIEIEGLNELRAKLNRMVNQDVYSQAMNKACRVVETAAKKNCPRDTGILKASIMHEVVNEGSEIVGYVGSNQEYAPFVEFGTGKYAEKGNGRKTPWAYEDPDTGETIWTAGQEAEPYLRPALEDNAERVKSILQDAVSKELNRSAGGNS